MIVRENMSLPVVVAYDWPEISTLEREVFAEKEDEGETEVIKSGDNAILTIDFSGMALPVKSQFLSCQFDLRQLMTTKIEQIGIPPITLDMTSLSFGVFRTN